MWHTWTRMPNTAYDSKILLLPLKTKFAVNSNDIFKSFSWASRIGSKWLLIQILISAYEYFQKSYQNASQNRKYEV